MPRGRTTARVLSIALKRKNLNYFEPDQYRVQSSEITHTLSFDLYIGTGSADDLENGCIEARRIRNETNYRSSPTGGNCRPRSANP